MGLDTYMIDEEASLKKKELDGHFVFGVRDALDEELDREIEREHAVLARQVVVEYFFVELKPIAMTTIEFLCNF